MLSVLGLAPKLPARLAAAAGRGPGEKGTGTTGPQCAFKPQIISCTHMAWLGMVRHGWSAGAGCGYHTSPAHHAESRLRVQLSGRRGRHLMSGRQHLQRCAHKPPVRGGARWRAVGRSAGAQRRLTRLLYVTFSLGFGLKAHLHSQPGGHSPVPAGGDTAAIKGRNRPVRFRFVMRGCGGHIAGSSSRKLAHMRVQKVCQGRFRV